MKRSSSTASSLFEARLGKRAVRLSVNRDHPMPSSRPIVASYRVRSHDERSVKRMEVIARHRTLGVTNQCRNGHLGKAEVVGDTREAEAQGVRSNVE